MVPTIASSGGSFKGAAAYYLHDKGADTRGRIAWTHTENLPTDNPDRAWKVQAWTAKHQADIKATAGGRASGRKLQKPVFAFSVAWHPEQKPDKAHMLATAKAAAAVLGLQDHQMIFVCHNDSDHAHVHCIANRVHPETGKAAALSRSKTKLAAWALEYEQQQGKVYCKAREANARHRAARSPTRERNPTIQAAWQRSDSGRSFVAALKADGFTLARGNRRLVVVDRWGKTHNPVRQLPGIKAAAFVDRLRDLDQSKLPTAAEAQRDAKAGERRRYDAARNFDQWASGYLNKTQDRHIEQRAAVGEKFARQLDAKRLELAKYYDVAAKKAAAEVLRQRIENAGMLRRLSGAADRDRVELARQERTIAEGEQRTAEAIGKITSIRDFQLSELAHRQAREQELAREHVAERKPTFYAEEKAPGEEKENDRAGRAGGRHRNDDDGGRERVQYRTSPAALRMI